MAVRPDPLLILGPGAAEHALARHLASGGRRVWVAPGNPGAASVPGVATAPVDLRDGEALVGLARSLGARCVVVNDPAALPWGAADHLAAFGIGVFGAPILSARLEASKRFAASALAAAGLPVLEGKTFERYAEARDAAAALDPAEWVVKPDGPGSRGRVCFPETAADLVRALEAGLVLGRFGDAGRRMRLERRAPGAVVCAVGLMGPRARFLAGVRLLDRVPGEPESRSAPLGARTLVPGEQDGLAERLRADFARFAEHLGRAGLGYTGPLELRALQDAAGEWRYFGVRTHLTALAGVVAVEALADPAGVLAAALPAGEAAGVEAAPPAARAEAVAYRAFAPRGAGREPAPAITGLAAAARLPDAVVLHARTESPEGARLLAGSPGPLTVVGRGATPELAAHHARRALTALEIGAGPAHYHRALP